MQHTERVYGKHRISKNYNLIHITSIFCWLCRCDWCIRAYNPYEDTNQNVLITSWSPKNVGSPHPCRAAACATATPGGPSKRGISRAPPSYFPSPNKSKLCMTKASYSTWQKQVVRDKSKLFSREVTKASYFFEKWQKQVMFSRSDKSKLFFREVTKASCVWQKQVWFDKS